MIRPRYRPAAIGWFAVLFMVAAAITFADSLSRIPDLSADAADMPIVLASARLTIALIPIALVWFMANPVARWMVAGLVLVRLASAPWSMQSGDAAPAWPELAALACALIAVGLLFTRRASHWFATRGHLSDDAAS